MPWRHLFTDLRDKVRDRRPGVRSAVREAAARANSRPQHTVTGVLRNPPRAVAPAGAASHKGDSLHG